MTDKKEHDFDDIISDLGGLVHVLHCLSCLVDAEPEGCDLPNKESLSLAFANTANTLERLNNELYEWYCEQL